MTERDRVRALVDKVVADARIPSARERDDLRRELLDHFEDSGSSADATQAAIARFGAPADVVRHLRRIYGLSYLAAYGLKIAAGVILSSAAACLIELGIEIVDHFGRLPRSSELMRPTLMAGAMILSLIAVSEVLHKPFSRQRVAIGVAAYGAVAGAAMWWMPSFSRVALTALALTVIFLARAIVPKLLRPIAVGLAFAAAEYGLHAMLGVALGPVRALTAGVVLLAIAATTAAILGNADRTFARLTGVAEG